MSSVLIRLSIPDEYYPIVVKLANKKHITHKQVLSDILIDSLDKIKNQE